MLQMIVEPIVCQEVKKKLTAYLFNVTILGLVVFQRSVVLTALE